jgi:hypothetical protein
MNAIKDDDGKIDMLVRKAFFLWQQPMSVFPPIRQTALPYSTQIIQKKEGNLNSVRLNDRIDR